MMRAVMDKPVLQRLVNHVKVVSDDELLVEYTDDGWRILMTDPAHVTMIKIDVGREAMVSYEVSGETAERKTCISVKKLAEALSVISDDGPMSLLDDGGIFRVDCGKIHRRIRKAGIFQTPVYPSLRLRCNFTLDTNDISKILSTGTSLSDHFSIECGPNGLRVIIEDSMDTSSYEDPEITPDCEDPEDKSETFRSMFPLDYFNKALKGINGEVLIEMDTDMPIRMLSLKPFVTVYLLAPRVEKDQE